MKATKKFKSYIAIVIAVSLVLLTFNNINYAKADTDKPNLVITYKETNKTSSTDVNGQINEDITVTYTVTPQDLDVSAINPSTAKEIVLVLDTSGSMNDSISNTDSTIRMDALKDAAKSFVDKLSTERNVKIGIVNYSTYANYNNLNLGLTLSSDSSIKSKIDGYHPKYWYQDIWGRWYQTSGNIEGATNMGDGIREAIKVLNNGSSTAKKYIVLMSDGEPTKYTYYRTWINYSKTGSGYTDYLPYNKPDNTTISKNGGYYDNIYYSDDTNDSYGKYYGGTGNSDDDGNALNYAKIMAGRMKTKNYSNFEIAYSSGSSADKMKQVQAESGGNFYSALDKDAIKNVYDGIADQIKSDYLVEGLKFNFTLPQGLEYAGSMTDIISHDGNTYVQQLPNISYKLNADRTKYTAAPFDIYLKFKASKSGNYSNLGQGWSVTYNDINKNLVTKSIPFINYTATSINIGFNLSKAIGGNPSTTNLGQEMQLNYSITPNDITMPSKRKNKEIVLVVDSNYSQKNNIKTFLSNFTSISDVNFALITYGTGATITNFGTSDLPKYFVTASSQTLGSSVDAIGTTNGTLSGSNLGDGLRKALYLLNDKMDVDRKIVVFGEGTPDYYSYSKNSDGQISYYNELDNLSGTTTEDSTSTLVYGNDTTKAQEYANQIATKIMNTKELNVSLFTAGDDSNDEVIKNISSSIAYTEFTKLSSNDDILKLKNFVNSDLIINGYIDETFPSGIELQNGGSGFQKNTKAFYNYNNTTGKYIGNTINISTIIKSTDIGNLTLNTSKFYYTDLEGVTPNISFPSISINSQSTSFIKQGVFFSNQSEQQGNLGESYINSNVQALTLDSNINIGTLVRSSLKHLVINIDISQNDGDAVQISSITASNIKIYRVGDDNKLIEDSSITAQVNGQKISVVIDSDSVADRRFIVKYNYKISLNPTKYTSEEKFFSNYSSLNVNTQCNLNDNTSDTFRYSIVGSPDLY